MPQDSVRLAGVASAANSPLTQLRARVVLLAAFVASIWMAFFLSAALPFLHLNRHGVVPRTLGGLQGAYSGDRDRHFRHRDRRFRFFVTAVSG